MLSYFYVVFYLGSNYDVDEGVYMKEFNNKVNFFFAGIRIDPYAFLYLIEIQFFQFPSQSISCLFPFFGNIKDNNSPKAIPFFGYGNLKLGELKFLDFSFSLFRKFNDERTIFFFLKDCEPGLFKTPECLGKLFSPFSIFGMF